MDEELTSGLGVRNKGRAGTGDIIGSATGHSIRKTKWMKPSADREEQPHILTSPSLMVGLHHPDICWMENLAGHKQFRRFPESTDGNLLLQGIEEPARGGVMLDLVLTTQERLEGNVEPKGSLVSSGHEMVEFNTL